MKNTICFLFICLSCFSCNTSSTNKSGSITETAIENDVNKIDAKYTIDSNNDTLTYQKDNFQEEEVPIESSKVKFIPEGMIKIGPKREFKSLGAFFLEVDEARDVRLVIDDGTYYENRIYVRGYDIIIEGIGPGVNLYCTEYGENVMEVSGTNIHIKNLSMKHFNLGNDEVVSCTGHVIMFDNAENVSIENCDLNGCGLSALHDNSSNSNILIKDCYIHNNSVGAYTNGVGGVWLKETADHPVFKFKNNRIENNGPNRIKEADDIEEETVDSADNNNSEAPMFIENEIEQWENVANPLIVKYTGVEWGDYFHLLFEDKAGTQYDFGFGNNNYGTYKLYDDKSFYENPKYLNQTFKLHWQWILSTYPCCNGEYEETEGLQPSIIKLELVETKSYPNYINK